MSTYTPTEVEADGCTEGTTDADEHADTRRARDESAEGLTDYTPRGYYTDENFDDRFEAGAGDRR